MADFGGRADKFGGYFERNWVLHLAIELLMERHASVRWEPAEFDGVDTVTSTAGRQEAHQCKRKNAAEGTWTIGRLAKEGVLKTAIERLTAGFATFSFVSLDSVPLLTDLIDHARTTNGDLGLFRAELSKKATGAFEDLLNAWNCKPHEAVEYLKQVRLERGFDREDTRHLEVPAELLADGKGPAILLAIAACFEKNIGTDVTIAQLRHALIQAGFPLRDLRADQRVAPAIDQARRRFCADLDEHLIQGSFVDRPEAIQCLEAATRDPGPRLLVVHGAGGAGKSAVLLEVVTKLHGAGIPVLPVRLDAVTLHALTNGGTSLFSLPASPSICLEAVAPTQKSVLVLDQVDSVRWTSVQSSSAWALCRDLIEQGLSTSRQTIVLACRTYDLKTDHLLSSFLERQKGKIPVEEVLVGLLDPSAVAKILKATGVEWAHLDRGAQELLRDPFNLRVWTLLRKSGFARTAPISRAALLREYWTLRRREVAQLPGVQTGDLDDLLQAMVEGMQIQRCLFIARSALARWEHLLPELLSLGVISYLGGDSSRVAFSHQSHRDFLIAESVLRTAGMSAQPIVDWVSEHQALIDRDQVKQALLRVRDEKPKLHVEVFGKLLASPLVRFHVKQLAMGVLASTPTPSQEECEMVCQLSGLAATRPMLWSGVVIAATSVAFFDALVRNGLISRQLLSSDATQRREAESLCAAMARRAPASTELALLRAFPSGSPPPDTLAACLGREPAADTDQMFAWRLSLVPTGRVEADMMLWDKELFARHPKRALAALALALRANLASVESQHRSRLQQNLETVSDTHMVRQFLELSGREPRATFKALLGTYLRCKKQMRRKVRRNRAFDAAAFARRRRLRTIASLLQRLLVKAATAIVSKSGPGFLGRLQDRFRQRLGSSHNAFVAGVLLQAPRSIADWALAWLLEAPRTRLGLGKMRMDGRSGGLSAGIVFRFAPHASPVLLHRLEDAILGFHTGDERRRIRQRLIDVRAGVRVDGPNAYGLAQQLLLHSIPKRLLRRDGQEARRRLSQKFGRPDRRIAEVRTGWVKSPLPARALERLSDADWKRLAATDWSKYPDWRLRSDWQTERSHPSVATDFGKEAAQDPRRFGQLLLELSPDVPEPYIASGLAGIARTSPPENARHADSWRPVTTEALERIVRRYQFRIEGSRELALGVARLVEGRPTDAWSLDVLVLLASLARTHPDPLPNHFAVLRGGIGDKPSSPDVVTSSYNCVRGVAASAIGHFLWKNSDWLSAFPYTIEIIASDKHAAVRVAAQAIAGAVYKTDHHKGLELFLRLCQHEDEAVLEGHELGRYLPYLWNYSAERLTPLLCRMALSGRDSLAEAGEYWLTASSVLKSIDTPERVVLDDAPRRRARANFWAHVVCRESERRHDGLRELALYVNDTDKAVTRATAQPFSNADFMASEHAPPYALIFVASAAVVVAGREFLDELAATDRLKAFAESLFLLAERLGKDQLLSTDNLGSEVWFMGEPLATLLFRLYEEIDPRSETSLHERCLDAIDALIQSNSWGSAKLLAQVDGTGE